MVLNDEIDFKVIKNVLARDLITQVLNKDHSKRPDLFEMAKHPWITKANQNTIDITIIEDPHFGNLKRISKFTSNDV